VRCVQNAIAAASTPVQPVILSPQGRPLTQTVAEELAAGPRLVLVCGRFAGFESGVYDALDADQLSVGDFVLNCGEVAALVVLDTVIRLLPGALDVGPQEISARKRCA
jgi:tRNA (guanine37-N1)-methyltransferase